METKNKVNEGKTGIIGSLSFKSLLIFRNNIKKSLQKEKFPQKRVLLNH